MKNRNNLSKNGHFSRLMSGFLIALAAVFWAFNLHFPERRVAPFERPIYEEEQIYVPISQHSKADEGEARKKPTLQRDNFKPVDDSKPDGDEKPASNDHLPVMNSLPHGEELEEIDENAIIYIPETMPAFPGGSKALAKFIRNAVRYPDEALANRIGGRVKVSFVVEKDGSLSDIQVVSAPKGFGLEAEAVRLVKAMPQWAPGKQGNIPVRVRFILPIDFVAY